MIYKLLILITICLLVSESIKAENKIKKKCFRPPKPSDMPDEVYDKFKDSSKQLSGNDAKDFWAKFNAWWSNVFAKVKEIVDKVKSFFQKLFSNKNKNAQNSTLQPPTPEINTNTIAEECDDSDDSSEEENRSTSLTTEGSTSNTEESTSNTEESTSNTEESTFNTEETDKTSTTMERFETTENQITKTESPFENTDDTTTTKRPDVPKIIGYEDPNSNKIDDNKDNVKAKPKPNEPIVVRE